MTVTQRPSSVRKHQAVLAAAERVFLEDGYLGAKVDDVAVLSGVSKQTIYRHFGTKEALFVELVSTITTVTGDQVRHEAPDPAAADELPAFLRDYAERQLTAVLTPRVLRLRRLVIGEVARFPDLGRALWTSGPDRAMGSLAERFRRFAAAGWLHTDHPKTAAASFNWLVMSKPLNEAMLLGDDAVPGTRALRRHCAEAVRVFLAGYGAAP